MADESAMPAAAPVSAPAAPAAPAASPAESTPAPTPSAPAESPAASEAPAPDPAAAAVPAPGGEGDGGTQGPEPKASDYPNDVDGQRKFLEDHSRWDRGDAVEPPVKDGEPAPEEVVPDPNKPADGEDHEDGLLPQDEASLTPESLQALLDGSPAMKAALAADPKAQNALFQMARVNAKLAPMGDLFPNIDSAKFANDTAQKFVGLRTSIMSSYDPESMQGAVGQFMDEFKLVDDKGQPVLDAAGKPQYGEDLDLFTRTMTNGVLNDRMAGLKEKIEKGGFASDQQKEDAEMALSALEFAHSLLNEDTSAEEKPDTSQMTPEAKAYFEREEARLEEQRKKLGLDKQVSAKEQVKADRQRFETEFRGSYGKQMGDSISAFLKEQMDGNMLVPAWVMDVKDPSTGVPVFGKNIVDKFNARIQSVPMYQAKLKEFELAPPTPENLKARLDYVKKIIADELGPIMKGELAQIQKREVEDQAARRQRRESGRKDARVEPSSGALGSDISTPGMTDEQAQVKATEMVSQEFPNLDGAERLAKIITMRHKIQSEGR